ncbi:MAG: phosphatidylinositol kinase [Bryocella sp.]
MAITMVQGIRRMRGGAQGQLMLGADGNLWVVKFQNNPQHLRVLANELLATKIAEVVGLTVPKTDVADVSAWLVENTPGMVVEQGRGRTERCKAGLQFGSQYAGGLMPGQVVDYLAEAQMNEVRNLREFAGMLAVDKWTGNCNGRQAVYEKKPRERKYRAIFIDQGYCFNAGDWTFPDPPLRGVFARNLVYREVTGWESFEPWLTRVEEFTLEALGRIAEQVPAEWYGGDVLEMERLLETMMTRRERVRELIVSFRDSSREPFPNWGAKGSVTVPRSFGLVDDVGKFVM